MNVRKNARLTPRGREILILRLQRGAHPLNVATAMDAGGSTAYKWRRRVNSYDYDANGNMIADAGRRAARNFEIPRGDKISMLCLDHLMIIAPSLAEGVEHIRACLDLDIPYGGTHPEMGTHNRVLRLGDGIYLEVIATDPSVPPPSGPRWLGSATWKPFGLIGRMASA